YHALGQDVHEDSPAAGAERKSQCDVVLARRGAGEDQVSDVGAGDEQYEQDGNEHRGDDGPCFLRNVFFLEWLDDRREAFVFAIALGKRGRETFKLRPGLLQRHTRLQPAENFYRLPFAAGKASQVDLQGYPEILDKRETETFRHYSYNRRRYAIDAYPFPEDCRVAVVAVHPDLVPEHDHRSRTRLSVLNRKPASDMSVHLNYLERRRRDERAFEALRDFVVGKIYRAGIERGQFFEAFLGLLPFGKVVLRDFHAVEALQQVCLLEVHDAFCLRIRQRRQHVCLYHREHEQGYPEPKTENQNAGQGKTRTVPELAQRLSHLMNDRLHR